MKQKKSHGLVHTRKCHGNANMGTGMPYEKIKKNTNEKWGVSHRNAYWRVAIGGMGNSEAQLQRN